MTNIRAAQHPRRVAQRLIEVSAVQYVVAGEELPGHRQRSVGELDPPTPHTNGGRARHRMEGTVRDEQPGVPQALRHRQPLRHVRPPVLVLLGLRAYSNNMYSGIAPPRSRPRMRSSPRRRRTARNSDTSAWNRRYTAVTSVVTLGACLSAASTTRPTDTGRPSRTRQSA